MKSDALDHPKMLELADWLDEELELAVGPETVAVGIMERLWRWAARYTPAGDIGRFSDRRIAAAVGWRGEPGRLIEGLERAGFVDADPVNRLTIHDWEQHCEDSVHARLARKREYFSSGARPSLAKLGRPAADEARRDYEAMERSRKGDDDGVGEPEVADGRRREPEAADGSLPGPEPKPMPLPEPGPGNARGRARGPAAAAAAVPVPAAGAAPGPLRDLEASPLEEFSGKQWREACRAADRLEAFPSGERVVGEGGVTRALALAHLAARREERGLSGWTWMSMTVALVSDLEEAREDATVRKIMRAIHRYPDGVYPGAGTADADQSGRQNSRMEQLHRRLDQLRGRTFAESRRSARGEAVCRNDVDRERVERSLQKARGAVL